MAKEKMQKLEKGFYIGNLALMFICLIPIIYLGWLLFIPAYAMAIANFIMAKTKDYKNLSMLVMILVLAGLIPVIGYFSRIVAGAFIIVILAKHWN